MIEWHYYNNKEQVKLAIIEYFTNGEYFNEWLDKHWHIIQDIDEVSSILELFSNEDLLKGIYYKDGCEE